MKPIKLMTDDCYGDDSGRDMEGGLISPATHISVGPQRSGAWRSPVLQQPPNLNF